MSIKPTIEYQVVEASSMNKLAHILTMESGYGWKPVGGPVCENPGAHFLDQVFTILVCREVRP